jgi:hypothetical protein
LGELLLTSEMIAASRIDISLFMFWDISLLAYLISSINVRPSVLYVKSVCFSKTLTLGWGSNFLTIFPRSSTSSIESIESYICFSSPLQAPLTLSSPSLTFCISEVRETIADVAVS